MRIDFKDLSSEINSYFKVFSEPLRDGSLQRSFGYGQTQWSAEDLIVLKNMKMPNVRQNLISKHIKTAVAEFASNVPALEVKGKKGASEKAVKTYQALIEMILKDGTTAFVKCYESLLRTGMSPALYIYNDYVDENGGFKQKIIIDAVDFENFYFDPNATHITKQDGNFMGYLTRMSKEVFKEKYPKAKPVDYEHSVTLVNDSWIRSDTSDEIVIAHHFRKVRKKSFTQYLTASGMVLTDQDTLPRGEEIIREREVTPTIIRAYKLNGQEILEEEDLPITMFPLVGCQGYYTIISGKYYPISYGYELQGLQRLQNIMLTQLCASVLYLRKNTTLWDASTLNKQTMDKLKNSMEPANIVMDLADQAKRPIRWNSEELSQSLLAMYRENMAQVDSTLGRYESTQGASSPQISSQTQAMQITQGNLPIFFYLHPMLMAIERMGEVLKEMIPKVYVTQDDIISGKDAFSLNSPDEQESLNFNDEEFDTNAYHISIRVGAAFAIQKERSLQLMSEIYKSAPDQMKVLMAPMMMEAMEIPNLPGLLDIFNKFLAFSQPQLYELMKNDDMQQIKQMGQQNQAQKQQMQGAAQAQVMQENQMKMQAEQQKLAIQQQELALKQAELQLKRAKQNMEELESASKYQLAMEEMDEKERATLAKAHAEVVKAEAEIEKARLEAQRDMPLF